MQDRGLTPTEIASLKPQQALKGTVKRIEIYGAFVDVGGGIQGLVHISRLSPRKVNRVEDVVTLEQEVDVWVVSADPASGRLELTMVAPVTLKWNNIQPGMAVTGKVVKIERFGAFVEIGAERPGLVHVSELAEGYVTDPSEVVHVGDEVTAKVLEVDRQKRQIRLSVKQAAEMELVEDEEQEESVETPMEAAFRRAREAQEKAASAKNASTASRPSRDRLEQEDLLTRTLKNRVQ